METFSSNKEILRKSESCDFEPERKIFTMQLARPRHFHCACQLDFYLSAQSKQLFLAAAKESALANTDVYFSELFKSFCGLEI